MLWSTAYSAGSLLRFSQELLWRTDFGTFSIPDYPAKPLFLFLPEQRNWLSVVGPRPARTAMSRHPKAAPTVPPPGPHGLAPALERNISILAERRREEQASSTRQEQVADAITRFTGSMVFVYIHLVVFGFWIVANLGWIPFVGPWDPSLVILAMLASVEAIFLSTFVLISQNRMAATADKRADLDVQISLLTEHEVTKLVTLVSALAAHHGVRTEADEEIGELKQNVAPEAVLDEIEVLNRSSEAV